MVTYRDSIVEKIRELAKMEYNLERQVKEYNSDRPIEEWVDYWQTRNDCRLSLAMTQTSLVDFIREESKSIKEI